MMVVLARPPPLQHRECGEGYQEVIVARASHLEIGRVFVRMRRESQGLRGLVWGRLVDVCWGGCGESLMTEELGVAWRTAEVSVSYREREKNLIGDSNF